MAGVCPRITTYPPLGTVTVLEPGTTSITFTAVIEWERNRAYPFDFKLSAANGDTGSHPSTWGEWPLPRTEEDSISRVISPGQDCRHASFTATKRVEELRVATRPDGSVHVKFAFQYQHYPGSPFKEMDGPSGVPVGETVIPARQTMNKPIDQVLTLEKGWTVEALKTEHEHASAWRITSDETMPPSQDVDTVLQSRILGRVVDQLRFMSIIRVEPFWFGAVHGDEYFHLTQHGVLACFLTKSGSYVSILAFNGTDDFYQVLTGGPEGAVALGCRNDSPSHEQPRLLVALADDRQESIAVVMAQARDAVEKTPKMQAMLEKALAAGNAQPGEDFFDNLGYCTWNGIGPDLTANKILAGLEQLEAAGIVFNTLLIDDNWQTLGNTGLDPSEMGWRGWQRFRANDEGFPQGLSGLIAEVKRRHPHIQYVGVWHAILGYWAGLAHDTELAAMYQTRMTRCKVRLSVEADVLVVDPVDVHRMYDNFYAFLRAEGVDFVKTDVQHLLSMLVRPRDRADIPAAYQSAWTAAYLKHFDGRAIGCMSQIPEIVLHSLLQRQTARILVRNNDDFFPEIPGSHPLHIFTNAHNALLTQHLNVLPDWDMFQTSHAYSSYHGAARAISGGPVLITDTPGEHGVDIIHQMTATTPSRKQIALRPRVATTLDFFRSYASGPILKVATSTETGAGIIGCFNSGEGERESLLPYADFERAAGSSSSANKFVVRSFCSQQIFPFESPLSRLVKVRLAPREWDILTATPLITAGQRHMSVLGLVDKMSGAAAVTQVDVLSDELRIELKAVGKLGVFVQGHETEIRHISANGRTADQKYISHRQEGAAGCVVSVDLGAWWKNDDLWNDSTRLTVELR